MAEPLTVREIIADVFQQGRDTLRVGRETVYYIFNGRRDRAAVWEQLAQLGNRSLVFILVTQGFLGAIMLLQAGFQATRILGDASLIGAQAIPLLVRQLGPTLTAMMIATRAGTGIAAEIGSMVVTEQVDALRMCNAPPVDHLIKPRLLASLVMVPVLTIVGTAAAFFAGMAVAAIVFQTNPSTYANFDVLVGLDVVEGLLKSVAFGIAIPLVAGTAGLSAYGGSEGVGEATTRAVVASSLAVIVLDFLIGSGVFLFR